jgi:hypothetical protein
MAAGQSAMLGYIPWIGRLIMPAAHFEVTGTCWSAKRSARSFASSKLKLSRSQNKIALSSGRIRHMRNK